LRSAFRYKFGLSCLRARVRELLCQLEQTLYPGKLTVKPSGSFSSSSVRPKLSRMKLSKHSAQKSSLRWVSVLDSTRGGNSQLLSIVLLLFLGETVLSLSNLKLAFSHQCDETDTQVGSSEIEREVFSLLLSSGPLLSVVARCPMCRSRLQR